MFEFITMDEEILKRPIPNTYPCVIDKSANIIIWRRPIHWTEMEMGYYYERLYITENYINIAFFELSCDAKHLPNGNKHITLGDEVIYNWSIISFEEYSTCTYRYSELLEILKEGLTIYGQGIQINQSHPNFTVTFNF